MCALCFMCWDFVPDTRAHVTACETRVDRQYSGWNHFHDGSEMLASHPNFHLRAIGTFRAIGGLSAWLTPDLLSRVYGGDKPEPESLLWSRIAASRELALAAGPLLSNGPGRRSWLQLGLACDVGDMAATLVSARGGKFSNWTIGLALTTYMTSALLTSAALRAEAATANP
jgi:hypothetical protein